MYWLNPVNISLFVYKKSKSPLTRHGSLLWYQIYLQDTWDEILFRNSTEFFHFWILENFLSKKQFCLVLPFLIIESSHDIKMCTKKNKVKNKLMVLIKFIKSLKIHTVFVLLHYWPLDIVENKKLRSHLEYTLYAD